MKNKNKRDEGAIQKALEGSVRVQRDLGKKIIELKNRPPQIKEESSVSLYCDKSHSLSLLR